MKTVGNILWLIFGGLESAICWFFIGLLWCITIIGIPFGKQCFKMAKLVIWPFGKKIDTNFNSHPIANVIWLVLFGLWFALSAIVAGALYCITIIGIPFGKQWFKMAKLFLTPFGAKIN